MKYRLDFITNSSSSSFILAFDNEKDYEEMKNDCEALEYKDIVKLFENIRENNSNEELRQDAIEMLKNYYRWNFKNEYINQKRNNQQFASFLDERKFIEECTKTKEFEEYMNTKMKTTEIEKKLEKIDKSDIIVSGIIWDTDGGLMEYAIRNELLKTYPFTKWLVLNFNVG